MLSQKTHICSNPKLLLHVLLCSVFLLQCLLSGCTLKLTTDLSKMIGIDSPQELMGSEEAQKIATRIGEGMGTKIMEGEILAEDMGKGFGEVFVEPQTSAIITDPVSVAIIEQNGLQHIQDGNYRQAIEAFKRTNNLLRIEQVALILFDRGDTTAAADLHQYLTDRGWSIRPPYLVAKEIEDEGLTFINSSVFKEVDPGQYNAQYNKQRYSFFETTSLNEDYIANHTVSKQEMLRALQQVPVIILADAYFVVKQHTCFLDIITSLNQDNLSIGLEHQLLKLKDNREAAETLNYSPLLSFIEENTIPFFTHGPEDLKQSGSTIDFFAWDTALAEKTKELVLEGRQVVIIIGDTHATPPHLPVLVETLTGINPAVVVQNPLQVSIEEILEEKVVCSEDLTSWGVSDQTVLSIKNDFYLNTEIPAQDFQNYVELFNLKPLLNAEQN